MSKTATKTGWAATLALPWAVLTQRETVPTLWRMNLYGWSYTGRAVTELRHHYDSSLPATSTLFWDHFPRVFPAPPPPRTRCGPCSTWCPGLPHADWCLQSDVVPNLGRCAMLYLVPILIGC